MANTTVEDILGDGLLAYWHAADLTVGDGNQVSAWADRKNSISMAQSSFMFRPTLRTNYSSTGYPAVEFNGSDQFLEASDSSLDVTKFAILFAALQNTAGTSDTVYQVGSSSYCRIMANSTTKGDYRIQNGAQSTTGAGGSSTGINVVRARCQATDILMLKNYRKVGQHSNPTTAQNSSHYHYMGSRGGTMQFFDGGIFAVAFVDLNECSWYGVEEAAVQMENDFGLTLLDTLPQAPSGGGGSSDYNPFRKPSAFGA